MQASSLHQSPDRNSRPTRCAEWGRILMHGGAGLRLLFHTVTIWLHPVSGVCRYSYAVEGDE